MGLARGQPVFVATTAPELFLRLCGALDKAGYETIGPVNTVPLAVRASKEAWPSQLL